MKQKVGDILRFNGTRYEILDQDHFPETNNPRKEICVQKLQNLNPPKEIQIRYCWWLDGKFQRKSLMTPIGADLQRIKSVIARW